MDFPALPDDVIRCTALQMACEFAETHQEAMAIADSFVEYIDQGAVRMEWVPEGVGG